MFKLLLTLIVMSALAFSVVAQGAPPPPEQPPENPVENGDAQEPEPVEPAPGYAHRVKDGKRDNQDRVLAALNWLRDHQSREGCWNAYEFLGDTTRNGAKATHCVEFIPGENGDKGWKGSELGLTGLVMLAYTGYGYQHRSGEYRAVLRSAIMYLRKSQDMDGCFGRKDEDHFVYNHAISTLAMAEIYGLSQDAVLKPMVAKAVEFILKARNPDKVWRYGVQPGDNDTSITSWMVRALHAATLAGIEVDTKDAWDGTLAWLTQITFEKDKKYKVGYDSKGSNNARLRSSQEYSNNRGLEAIYIELMLIIDKKNTRDKVVKALIKDVGNKQWYPVWERYKIDFYAWYYTGNALHVSGAREWKNWWKEAEKTLTEHQRGWHEIDEKAETTTPETLDEHGSWDPVGAWGSAGGRVYATAMGALILQTEWREKG